VRGIIPRGKNKDAGDLDELKYICYTFYNKGGYMREYKRIDLKSEADFKKAERLHAQGFDFAEILKADYVALQEAGE